MQTRLSSLQILLITQKRVFKLHRKRERLKGAVSKIKVLGNKKQWTRQRVDKATDKTIKKTYAKYKQRELTGRVKITRKNEK